jgi:predicted ATPase/DNA-binding CsgD family transcriptional regulator
VDAVCSLIVDEDVRLLTLTGPGGVGKTRLALRAAETLLPNFEDGAYFVALAPLIDPDLVIPAIAQALGLKEEGGIPLVDTLKDYLHDKGMLLILDNFEQVAAAATQIKALLADASGMQLIITSRASLHLYGEYEYGVAPMSMPDLEPRIPTTVEELGGYDAVQLLVARAREVRQDFALTDDNADAITRICHRLDGLPLALELAAARTRLFSPQTLLARLGKSLPLLTGGPSDVPVRHQTLSNTIAWSYNLLDAVEQKIFTRLSVFVGGFTLAATIHLMNDLRLQEDDLISRLEALIDKNLMRKREQSDGEPRFWMLATIREYALEKLADTGELDSVSRSHAEFFISLANQAWHTLHGPEQASWFEKLDRDHDNLRLLFAHLTQKPGLLTTRLVAVFGQFWHMRGYLSEGRRWLDSWIDLVDIEQADAARDWHLYALIYAGVLAGVQSDYERAIEVNRKGVAEARILGDEARMMYLLGNLAILARRQGDYKLVEELQAETVKFRDIVSDEAGVSGFLHNLAVVQRIMGRFEQAEALFSESIAIKRETGDKQGLSISLQAMSDAAREQGDFERAYTLLEEALALCHETSNQYALPHVQVSLALLLCEQGVYEEAQAALREGLESARATGEQYVIAVALIGLGRVALQQRDYPHARSFLLEALDTKLRVHEYDPEMVASLECMAAVEVGEASTNSKPQRFERAALLLGAAESRREEVGAPIPPIARTHYTQLVQTIQSRLAPPVFRQAWSKGRALSLEEAAALAYQPLLSGRLPTTMAGPNPAPVTTRGQGDDVLELTERELDVLRLLAQGMTNKEIGERLVLSHRTVQSHLYRVFSKLDVTTRSAATRYALERGIV